MIQEYTGMEPRKDELHLGVNIEVLDNWERECEDMTQQLNLPFA